VLSGWLTRYLLSRWVNSWVDCNSFTSIWAVSCYQYTHTEIFIFIWHRIRIIFQEYIKNTLKPEEASTHKSAKTPLQHFFVPCDLDLWPFDPKIYGFPGQVVDHFYVKFGDSTCRGFWDIVWINRQANASENPTPATAVGAGNKLLKQLQTNSRNSNDNRQAYLTEENIYMLTTYKH